MELQFFLGIAAGAIVVLAAFLVPAIIRFSRTVKAAEDFFRTWEGSIKPLAGKLDETIDRTNRVVQEVEDSMNNVQNLTKAVGETGDIVREVNGFIRKTQLLVSVNTSSLGAGIKTALAVLAQGMINKEVGK